MFGIFSLIFWLLTFLIYKYLCWKHPTTDHIVKLRLTNHYISTVHAVICIYVWLEMTFISCKLPGKTFFSSFTCINTTSPAMEVGMVVTTSYLVQDMISVRFSFGRGR